MRGESKKPERVFIEYGHSCISAFSLGMEPRLLLVDPVPEMNRR